MPFLLALWIRPAPPMPEPRWTPGSMLSVIVLLSVLVLVVVFTRATTVDSTAPAWGLGPLFLGGWSIVLYRFARGAAATFPVDAGHHSN